ncbi:MAG TPA: DJ-1/PfpI family protein [Thermoleophilaceae bacterium]|jgi:putative intracellular protease/amidase
MRIAIPIFDRLTALDAVGPYEVLSRVPGATVHFVAAEPGVKRTETNMLGLSADIAMDDLTDPDIFVVPGGYGTRALLEDDHFVGWVRRAHETSRYSTSVCTGSLVLAAAGILDGLEATTHWLEYDRLGRLGAKPTSRRVVEQGKVITAAGVSSGIDMALVLAAHLAGEDVAKAIQLGIEYDPQPPFDSGSPAKAGERIVELVTNAERREQAALEAAGSGG